MVRNSSSLRTSSLLSLLVLALVAVALGAFASPAWADPPDQTVVFILHEDPEDMESDRTFSFVLELKAYTVGQGEVGWQVQSMTIRQYREDEPVEKWVELLPTVVTQDGLWWVDHADTDEPVSSEFTISPEIGGVAANVIPQGDDLDYVFKGVSAPGPQHTARMNVLVIGYVSYLLVLVDGHPGTTIGEGDDEPGEVIVGDGTDAE